MFKEALKKFLKATRLNLVIEWSLGASLFAVFGMGRIVSWLYGRAWPALNIGYYDQRFSSAAGPAAWRWAERGMFAYRAAQRGGGVLDLCCGDGFYVGTFLRDLGGVIDAIDRDAQAISRASKRYMDPNLHFHVADVINDPFPKPDYDLVSCFASLQYFTSEQTRQFLQKIAKALTARRGAFVGSAPVFTPPRRPDPGAVHNFGSVDEIKGLLDDHFGDVQIWCSVWAPGATHVYFTCSQPISR